jgi:hypothetical protein
MQNGNEPATTPEAATRQILVVAGSGRSGTSLFAGLTGRLGFHIPKPEVSANRSNPRGFGEPRWAVDFHNELLKRVDVVVEDGRPEAWDLTAKLVEKPEVVTALSDWLEQQFGEADRLVVKDPRLAWFFEVYRVAATGLDADLRVATMLRDPAEVMKSREVAYGTRTGNTTRIVGWMNMMLGIEARTRDLPRATLSYPDLLTDWKSAIGQADESLGLGLVSGASEAAVAEADDLVDPGLRRSIIDWDELELPARTRDLASRVYETYGGLVGTMPSAQAEVRAELDALGAEFVEYYDECFDVARTRTGATVRKERRKAVRRVREEQRDAGHGLRARAARLVGRKAPSQ